MSCCAARSSRPPRCTTTSTRYAPTFTDLRSLLVDAARDRELRLIASGTVVHGQPANDSKIGPDTRYHRMVRRYGRMVYGGLTCGCHVHVGIADREQAIRVINRLRPWLPLLLAVSANSPFHEGRDTGYASSRYLLWSRWPTAGLPPPLESVEHYERVVRGMLATGAAMDRKMVYWTCAPPSTRTPSSSGCSTCAARSRRRRC